MSTDKKNNWSSGSGFVWAAIGSAVGFANILSFSAKAYFYGGGAFLIPFTIAMLVVGIPLLFLEGVIGQYFGLPIASAFKKVTNKYGAIFGWLPVFAGNCSISSGNMKAIENDLFFLKAVKKLI